MLVRNGGGDLVHVVVVVLYISRRDRDTGVYTDRDMYVCVCMYRRPVYSWRELSNVIDNLAMPVRLYVSIASKHT